jgi:hypothetical protein
MADALNKNALIDTINALTVDGDFTQQDVNYLMNWIIANGNMAGTPRDLIQIRRGNKADLPTLAQGELAVTLDTKEIYVGGLNGNINIMQQVKEDIEQYVKYKRIYISDTGAIGDDNFRTISAVFPNVTLANVQMLNPGATLNNSADWYAIAKVLYEVEENTAIIFDGQYVIDLPLEVDTNLISLEGKNEYRWQWGIRQIGANQSLIRIRGSYQSIKNLFLQGTLSSSYKSKHGIEIIVREDAAGVQSDHMLIQNCYIQNHGGDGIHCLEASLILAQFRDCIIHRNYDNGIYFYHTPDTQQNALTFFNVSNYGNGLELTGGIYQRITTPTVTRGHGYSISGTAIAIISGDTSENGSAGVFVHDGYYTEGLVVMGMFFENNKLANVYYEGRKPFSLIGNYMYPVGTQVGNIYSKYPTQTINDDLAYDVMTLNRRTRTPIQSYIESGNKEIVVTAITSNFFISNSHGLVNGDIIYPIMNKPVGVTYSADVYPNGIYQRGEDGYYVVNSSPNQFQVSLTSGGTPVVLVGDPDTYDLTKWHFETAGNEVYVTNLITGKQPRLRARIKGQLLVNEAPVYILPVADGIWNDDQWIVDDGEQFTYPMTNINADVFLDIEVIIKLDNYVSVNIEGYAVASSSESVSLKVRPERISKNFVRLIQTDGANGIRFAQCYFANGTTIDIYEY